MSFPANQSPTSWSSGEPLRWWNAVEGNQKKDLTKRMFIMIRAINEPNVSQVESLIRRGADLEAQDEYGRTALDWAVQKGRTDIVEAITKWKRPGGKGRFVTPTATWGEK